MRELLERDDEVAGLRRLVEATSSGAGGLLVIEGDAGIGKTGLVRAAVDMAGGRGVRVLAARGAELERDLAFGVVRELFEASASGLDGAAALAAPVLASTPVSAQDLFAALHGLYWLAADLGGVQPTLLVVDDAQWCDVASLRFLAYLAHRIDGLPVGVLVAARPEAAPAQQDLLGVLAAEPDAVLVRPQPLTATATGRVVAASLGEPDPEFTAACRTSTGGNPFLLGELLAELRAAGIAPRAAGAARLAGVVPRGVLSSVRTRLGGLPAAAVALARAAAVLGDRVDARRAARLAGLPPEEVAATADALVTARFVEPDVALTFLHPLLRSAVASTLGPAELAVAHRRAAEMLRAEGERGDALLPHLLAAPAAGDPWVVEALRGGARRAAGRGAPDAAVRYLTRAWNEPPAAAVRHPLLLELGLAEMQAGSAEALDHLSAAADEAPDVEARARATLLLARTMLHAGRIPDAVRRCERVIEELAAAEHPDPDLVLELEVELVTIATQDVSTRPVAVRWHARRSGDPEPASRAACMLLANLAIEEVIGPGSRERAVELAERALTDGHLLGRGALVTLPSAVISLTLSGRPARSIQVWDEVIAHKRSDGDVRGYALAAAFRGYATYYTGDLDGAIADTRSALALARTTAPLPLTEWLATAWLAYALIDVGELDAADRELDTVATQFANGAPFTANYLLSARGQLRCAQGRFDEAVADLEECGRRAAAWNVHGPALYRWRPHLALALLGCGDGERAATVAADALRRARAWGAPFVLAEALRAAGLTAADETGEALLREAVDVAVDLPVQRARALVALGSALRRDGNRVAARQPLRDALDVAVAHGAGAVARSAHEELVVAGARPRRLRATGADALTATERRVAVMAMGGLTNRAVAQALFVSEKTVETHLGHAYRKLGVTGRSQLAGPLTAPSD